MTPPRRRGMRSRSRDAAAGPRAGRPMVVVDTEGRPSHRTHGKTEAVTDLRPCNLPPLPGE
eukprot:1590767-Alexandrium_andersonii.AAC.1